MRLCALYTLLIILLANVHQAQAFTWKSWPPIPLDATESAQWLVPDINRNGYALRILGYVSSQPAEAILDFYQHAWQHTPEGSKINQHEQMQLISHLNEEYLYTVAIQPIFNQQVEVTISQQRLSPETHQANQLDPHLPLGSEVISDTQAVDNGTLSRVIAAQHHQGPQQLKAHFTQTLESMGWQRQPSSQASKGYILLNFTQNKDSITVTLKTVQNEAQPSAFTLVYLRKP